MGCIQTRSSQVFASSSNIQITIVPSSPTTKNEIPKKTHSQNQSPSANSATPAVIGTTSVVAAAAAPPASSSSSTVAATVNSAQTVSSPSTGRIIISLAAMSPKAPEASSASIASIISPPISPNSTRAAVRSPAQLDFEFNNCNDHFNKISLALQHSSQKITQHLGYELSSLQYTSVYQEQREKMECNKQGELLECTPLLADFENFFAAIDHAISILPMIESRCEKLELQFEERKSEAVALKRKVTSHLMFCKSIKLPTQFQSESTFDDSF